MFRRLLAALALVAVAGCGGDALVDAPDAAARDFAVDATLPPDLAIPLRDPKEHPDQPFIFNNGGRLLRHIQVVTVTWEGDALADARHRFAAWMVDSSYYDPLIEYGLSRGTAVGPFALPGPAPAKLDDAGVGPLLRAAIAQGTVPPPATDTLYVLYLPAGTESTLDFGRGCFDYGGYHWFAATGMQTPKNMAYAIIPTCVNGPAQFDSDTVVVSHEITEAASDPEGTGWVDPMTPLSEIADLCTPLGATVTADGGDAGAPVDYQVSRYWSAKTAQAGNADPCVPVPPPPYAWFNAGVDPLVTMIDLTGSGTGKVQKTINIEPFAFGPVGIITWQIVYGPGPGISFSPTKGQGGAGSTQPVTVTVTQDSDLGPHVLMIEAHAKSWTNVWYATVDVE